MKKRLLSFFLLLFIGILCLNINSSHAYILSLSVSHSPTTVTVDDVVVVNAIIRTTNPPIQTCEVVVAVDGTIVTRQSMIHESGDLISVFYATIGKFPESAYVQYTVETMDSYGSTSSKTGSFTVEQTTTTTTTTTTTDTTTTTTTTDSSTSTDSSTTSDTHSPEYTPPPSNLDSNIIASGVGTAVIILLIASSATFILIRRKNR